jgi:hypothetical protein
MTTTTSQQARRSSTGTILALIRSNNNPTVSAGGTTPSDPKITELQNGLGQETSDSGTPAGLFVAFTQSRLAWDTVRKVIQDELSILEHSILDTSQRVPQLGKPRLEAIANSTKQLYLILQKLDERLIDTLDEALNAKTPEDRSAHHAKASQIVNEYRAFVDSDPLVKQIDDYPIVKINVRGPLIQTLDELRERLG